MSRKIFITNLSNHDQEFEVHGWNNNQNMTVHAHSTNTIDAKNGSSGAIIALHGGHEGEQAEITKDGFEGELTKSILFDGPKINGSLGNDFIDLSNIVGAGGNMTVQQVDSPTTRKGDPLFMQNLNAAWDKASPQTKAGLSNCVFTQGGKVVRIGPIKDFPKLEAFVRTFADGKTYIGVGAWNGSPGNPKDNHQSSAAHGNKDIQVTYSDGDASPPVAHGKIHNLQRHPVSLDHALSNGNAPPKDDSSPKDDGAPPKDESSPPKDDSSAPKDGTSPQKDNQSVSNGHPTMTLHSLSNNILIARHAAPVQLDNAHQKPGAIIYNRSGKECKYAFYNNTTLPNGSQAASFTNPSPVITLKAGESKFVGLDRNFKGRVQRGTELPATWGEFQVSASNDGKAHGDISLEQGCDGAATVSATDGSGQHNGFTKDILTHAPVAAIHKKPNGEKALGTTMGNWESGPNQAAIDWENKEVGQRFAYITGGTGVPDVASANQCLQFDFY